MLSLINIMSTCSHKAQNFKALETIDIFIDVFCRVFGLLKYLGLSEEGNFFFLQ